MATADAISVTGNGRSGALRRLADDESWLLRLLIAPAILYIVLLVGIPFFLSLYYTNRH